MRNGVNGWGWVLEQAKGIDDYERKEKETALTVCSYKFKGRLG